MLDPLKLNNQVNQFLSFLEIIDKENLSDEISSFFSADYEGDREVLHDNGSIQMYVDGRLNRKIKINEIIDTDRIVKFDGSTIIDINPRAYMVNASGLNGLDIHSKGDGANKSTRRSGGTSSNNNNNNNNNG